MTRGQAGTRVAVWCSGVKIVSPLLRWTSSLSWVEVSHGSAAFVVVVQVRCNWVPCNLQSLMSSAERGVPVESVAGGALATAVRVLDHSKPVFSVEDLRLMKVLPAWASPVPGSVLSKSDLCSCLFLTSRCAMLICWFLGGWNHGIFEFGESARDFPVSRCRYIGPTTATKHGGALAAWI